MYVGQSVRVAPRGVLEALLRTPDSARPEPAQFAHAGRAARISSATRVGADEFRYRLDGVPGWWRGEWLAPAEA